MASAHRGGLIGRILSLLDGIGASATPYVLLLLRILFGYALFRAGYGKFMNLDRTEQFFTGLGIPMPGLNAILVAAIEAAGGLLVMVGLATRAASAVLIVVLAVAAVTAHRAELALLFSNPGGALGASPVPYLAILLVLGSIGAGRLSMDHVVAGKRR